MNPAQTVGTFYRNLFTVLADRENRDKALAVVFERAPLIILGVLIALVGVAFLLANSKAGKVVIGAVDDVAGLVITKGASKGGTVAKAVA